MRALAVLSCLWLTACVHRAVGGAPPASDAPDVVQGWREYRTAHFLVDTDVSSFEAESLINDLENAHAMVLQALVGEIVDIPGHLRVIAMGDQTHFRKMTGDESIGGYQMSTELGEPLIVVPVAGFKADPETLAHELTHYVSWFVFPRQSSWFSEGLATFVQTVGTVQETNASATGSHIQRGERTAKRGRVGVVPPETLQGLLRMGGLVPAAELLQWKGVEDRGSPGRHHLSSWMLYHWLWNNRSNDLAEYQKRLASAEAPDVAWSAVFPEFDPRRPGAMAALDEALDHYLRAGRYVYYSVPGEPRVEAQHPSVPLTNAGVRMLLLDGSYAKPGEAALHEELDAVVREDPTEPLAVVDLARLDKGDALPALRLSVSARPADWRAWLLFGMALNAEKAGKEREAALRKAVELNPESARANNELAWFLVTHSRAHDAFPFADRALDLDPANASVLDTFAAVLSEVNRCPEALILERRAAELAEREARGSAIAHRLQDYEKRCGSAHP